MLLVIYYRQGDNVMGLFSKTKTEVSNRNRTFSNPRDQKISDALWNAIDALTEKKYMDPADQLGCYILSGDDMLMTNHKDARTRMKEIDSVEIVKFLIKEYCKE